MGSSILVWWVLYYIRCLVSSEFCPQISQISRRLTQIKTDAKGDRRTRDGRRRTRAAKGEGYQVIGETSSQHFGEAVFEALCLVGGEACHGIEETVDQVLVGLGLRG